MSATTTQRTKPDPTPLDIGTLASLVSCERRRIIIAHVVGLADGGVTTTRELSELIAAEEAGEDWTTGDRKRAYIALSQLHLRKLDDAGVLIQTGENRFIRGPNAERAQRAVDVLGEVCEG